MPVCATEVAELIQLNEEFVKRNIKIIALSCDSIQSHLQWQRDIKSLAGISTLDFPFPIIADEDRILAVKLNIIDSTEFDANGTPLAGRAVFVIDPKKKTRLSMHYPGIIGRDFR